MQCVCLLAPLSNRHPMLDVRSRTFIKSTVSKCHLSAGVLHVLPLGCRLYPASAALDDRERPLINARCKHYQQDRTTLELESAQEATAKRAALVCACARPPGCRKWNLQPSSDLLIFRPCIYLTSNGDGSCARGAQRLWELSLCRRRSRQRQARSALGCTENPATAPESSRRGAGPTPPSGGKRGQRRHSPGDTR